MKTFLKKYWVHFLLLIASSLLFLILIPNEEKSYLDTEVQAIRKISGLILISIILILLGVIFISAFKHLKSFKQFLNFIPGILFLGIVFFLILSPIFLFAAFSLNKFSAKELVERKYKVIHTDTNYLELQNLQSGKVERIEQIVQENEKYIINKDDTLILSFKKGLFGFEFDPTHSGNFVYPD